MNFQRALYLEFAKELHVEQAECNLAFSGISCPFSWTDLGIDAQVLPSGQFHPYGNAELKEQIARRYGVKPAQVLCPGGGTSLSNFLIAATLLEGNDAVILESPTYEPLAATIASSGARIMLLLRSPESDYGVDLDQVKALFKPPVKLLALTRLHNPSGKNMPDELLQQLGEMAAAIGAYVLMDEVYLDFLPSQTCKIGTALHPRLITTASLTKVYGQGDLRLGWAIGPEELIRRAWLINNVLGAVPPTIPERIALELFRNGSLDKIASWSRRRAAENVAIIESWLRNHSAFSWVKPDGGIIAFIRLRGRGDAGQFVTHLRNRHRTLVMPGRFFNQPDGFRLGFGCDAAELSEGLGRLELAFAAMTPESVG